MQDYLDQLRPAFHTLLSSYTQGVQGVITIRGAEAGPSIGIGIGTHGNEPAGLGAVAPLLLGGGIACGTLRIFLNNVEAMQRYFNAADDAARSQYRYLDRNMNRLPANLGHRELTADSPYEHRRMQQLLPLLEQCRDGYLDLHSTSADCPPILIAGHATRADHPMSQHVPVALRLTDMAQHMRGRMLMDFAGDRGTVRLLVECGQHHLPQSALVATAAVSGFLTGFEMLEKPLAGAAIQPVDMAASHYKVLWGVWLPEDQQTYCLESALEPFTAIADGQILARSQADHCVISPMDGYAVLCPHGNGELSHDEEVLFICEKL